MNQIVIISGSPSASSRTLRLAQHFGSRLSDLGLTVDAIDVRTLPAGDLIGANGSSSELRSAFGVIERASGLVVASPIYKAAYSGVLKTFLDVLPPDAFSGKAVLPLTTGGTPAHALSIDFALRPILFALGASLVLRGLFLLDKEIALKDDGRITLDEDNERKVGMLVEELAHAVQGRLGQRT